MFTWFYSYFWKFFCKHFFNCFTRLEATFFCSGMIHDIDLIFFWTKNHGYFFFFFCDFENTHHLFCTGYYQLIMISLLSEQSCCGWWWFLKFGEHMQTSWISLYCVHFNTFCWCFRRNFIIEDWNNSLNFSQKVVSVQFRSMLWSKFNSIWYGVIALQISIRITIKLVITRNLLWEHVRLYSVITVFRNSAMLRTLWLSWSGHICRT